jgi:hypothetical protein
MEKNRYHLSWINDLFQQLKGARIFSKIDLRLGYHQVRNKEIDTVKMVFRTTYDHYEFMVVPFGLTIEPTTFICIMNGVFKDYLETFVIIFLDDIHIYS